jgi:hypothetical protein
VKSNNLDNQDFNLIHLIYFSPFYYYFSLKKTYVFLFAVAITIVDRQLSFYIFGIFIDLNVYFLLRLPCFATMLNPLLSGL